MVSEKIKKLIIGTLRSLESNIIQNQEYIARLLALFEEEPYSKDGAFHLSILRCNKPKKPYLLCKDCGEKIYLANFPEFGNILYHVGKCPKCGGKNI